jgi:predicted nucleic acid-binding protein
MSGVIADTGPLVALLNRGDQFHAWVKAKVSELQPPFLTCEVVIAEASFLLRPHRPGVNELLRLVSEGHLIVPFRLEGEARSISELMNRYASVPMSLADACLVRMAELHDSHSILTLDADFRIYRMHRRQHIPAIMPDDR